MRLYHYRSIENGLLEIENGTFHFSGREELNDPIEGYIQIYWQGDKPAWEGLFRNYVASLFHSIWSCLMGFSYDEICNWATIPSVSRFSDIPLGEVLTDLGNAFVDDDSIKELIAFLGRNDMQYSAKNMKLILQLIHETAYSICVSKIKTECRYDSVPEPETSLLLKNLKRDIPEDNWDKMSKYIDSNIEGQKILLSVLETLMNSFEDRFEFKMTTIEQNQVWLKLRIDFPDLYIHQMQEMIYPKGYVVCFSASGTNSVMWGNYADKHRGICLIYQTESNMKKETIPTKTGIVYGRDGTSFYFTPNEVKKINYTDTQLKRNFFQSLGHLNYNQLSSWLMPDGQNASSYLKNYRHEEWRQQYWDDYDKKYHSKMPMWAYEEEYRLFISDGTTHTYSDQERNFQYKPETLVGVVFGIKTPIQNKRKILEALIKSGRDLNEIEFYQAEYNDDKRSITLRKKYEFMSFGSSKSDQ